MLGIKHILFPIDFSEQCLRIVPFVKAWAAHFDARVTLLNVLEIPPAYCTESPTFITAVDIESLLRVRKERLESFASESFRRPEDRRAVIEGLTPTAILDFVQREAVGLVMMPTRGYGPFRRFLLGSVTAKVLHDSAGPIWTSVHVEQPSAATPAPDCRRILCAVDLTPESVSLIRWAKELANSYGATLRLVHAVTGCSESDAMPEGSRFREFMSDFARKEVEKAQQAAGTNAEVQICGGEVAHAVRQAALHFNSDLAIIGRGVLQEPLGRLRSNTYAIIRESPCPVLSL